MARKRKCDEFANHPELIELCINCKHAKCNGWCEEYQHKYHLIRYGTEPRSKQEAVYTYKGQSLTAREWAIEYGLQAENTMKLLKRGMSIEEVIESGICKSKGVTMLEYRGERKSISGWARASGLSKTTIRDRLKKGMTIAEALTTPRAGTGKKNKNGANVYEQAQSNV